MERVKLQPASTAIHTIEDYAMWPWALMLSVILSVATAMSVVDGTPTPYGDIRPANHRADAMGKTNSYPMPDEATDAPWTGVYIGVDATGLPVYRFPSVNVVASRKVNPARADKLAGAKQAPSKIAVKPPA